MQWIQIVAWYFSGLHYHSRFLRFAWRAGKLSLLTEKSVAKMRPQELLRISRGLLEQK